MNSTETPGGSGIPAGWYDDPSGQGLRWWDGDQWTEHVHTAESAAAATGATGTAGEGEREAPPPQLVKLRESIQARGAKGVGMVLGGLVLAIVVVALLLSGGDDEGSGAPPAGAATPTTGKAVVPRQQIRRLRRQLKNEKLPKAEKKSLEKQLKQLEKTGGASQSGKNAKSGNAKSGNAKSAKAANAAQGAGKAATQKKTPGKEGG